MIKKKEGEIVNMNLEESLLKCKTKYNQKIIRELINYIKEEKISNINELDDFENKIFTIDGKLLNNNQRIKYCLYNIKNCYFDYDGLSLSEIKILKQLKNNINDNDEEIILNIIKINAITNREIMFIKEAYEYILSGKL